MPDSQWICSKHWVLVPRALRRRYRLARKLADRADAAFCRIYDRQGQTFTDKQWQAAWRVIRLRYHVWGQCRRTAIERAAGIG